MTYTAVKNALGYFSVDPMPSAEELEAHYRDKYYQEEHGSRSHSYSEIEHRYFENGARAAEHIANSLGVSSPARLLDLGAGEGFFSKYFFAHEWSVTTCDFSSYGMQNQNPQLLETLMRGDIMSSIAALADQGRVFELINMQNVLEHVIDPTRLLQDILPLIADGGALRIVVPNDYSAFQTMLQDHNLTGNTWFAPPEHLHYFNFETLPRFLESCGYGVRALLSDFPIEMFLLNDHSNYVQDRTRGNQAHRARLLVDNYLADQGVERYVQFYTGCAAANIGRQAVAFATRS